MRIAISIPLTARYGLNGFWAGMAIAWIAEVLVLALIYCKSWWIPKDIREAT